MKISIDMVPFRPETLVPKDGFYLIRIIEPQNMSIHYIETYISKDFDKTKGKFVLVFKFKREKVITHISKMPLR